MLITELEAPNFGCLQTFLAYVAAVYVSAAALVLPEGNAPNFLAVLFAPLYFPIVATFGVFMGEVSEIGNIGYAASMMLLFFIAVFGIMIFLVRQSQKRQWVGWVLGGVVVGLLVACYFQSS